MNDECVNLVKCQMSNKCICIFQFLKDMCTHVHEYYMYSRGIFIFKQANPTCNTCVVYSSTTTVRYTDKQDEYTYMRQDMQSLYFLL